ncbi:MAG: Ldh family oxidoreductase, partial [Thermostichus sp. BF3_bins_97]
FYGDPVAAAAAPAANQAAAPEEETTEFDVELKGDVERGAERHPWWGRGPFRLMVDILAGQLSFATGFSTLAHRRGGHFVAAFDIAAFGDPDEFRDNMDGMLRGLRESKPMPGHDRVFYAGLPDVEIEADRLERGIPLHPEVVDWFRTACTDLAVPVTLL